MRSFSFYRGRAKRILVLSQIFFVSVAGYCQNADDDNNNLPNDNRGSELWISIQRIDSISHTESIAGHFARIYTASMGNINVQLAAMDSNVRSFIKKFEVSFINYFLDACSEFESGHLSQESVWSNYFTNPNADSWQLTLVGVNAHINGDIWKGLINNFSAGDIRKYKKKLLSFQRSIAKAFKPFFNDLMQQSSYLRFINGFTKDMARRYGEWLIYNWRLRQINLAILYYEDNEKFKRKLEIIKRKKNKIDRVILRKRKTSSSTEGLASLDLPG